MKKVAVIGAGTVGSQAAHLIVENKLADVVLLDILDGRSQGVALDIMHSLSVKNNGLKCIGTSDYKDIEGSDIVVIAAGFSTISQGVREREELLRVNAKIVSEISERIKKHAPSSAVVVVSNPLDVMTYLALKKTGFEKNKVMGVGNSLDTARLKYFIAEKHKVSVKDVDALVIGCHGEQMVPLLEAKVKEKPIVIDSEILEKAKNASKYIINLANQPTCFGPASAIYEIVESIVKDKKSSIPVSALLENKNICIGMPALIGANGIEKVPELKLNTQNKEDFDNAISAIKEAISSIDKSLV